MTYDALNDLLITYQETPIENLFEVDYWIFTLFYDTFYRPQLSEIPEYVVGFTEIDSWQGMSFRCGVWQYYENNSFSPETFETVINLLKKQGENEFAEIFAYGIHDYCNPKYENNYNYPEEWLEQSDKIDDWIYENEEKIYKWKRDLILSHREEVLNLADDKN